MFVDNRRDFFRSGAGCLNMQFLPCLAVYALCNSGWHLVHYEPGCLTHCPAHRLMSQEEGARCVAKVRHKHVSLRLEVSFAKLFFLVSHLLDASCTPTIGVVSIATCISKTSDLNIVIYYADYVGRMQYKWYHLCPEQRKTPKAPSLHAHRGKIHDSPVLKTRTRMEVILRSPKLEEC
jgi:hypothetical protein